MKAEIVKQYLTLGAVMLMLLAVSGCGPAIFAGGATGTYKAETDERSLGRQIDDSTITAKIKLDLTNDKIVRARNIDVDTIDGNVILTGMVDTEFEAERAVDIAQRVSGVKEVNNNLQIGSRTFRQVVSDKVIGSKVKGKLLAEPGIRALSIDVDVYSGVVTLSGVVGDQETKDKIIDMALTTEGTVKIVDNIYVK